jgi:hypothetical protein
MLYRRWFAILSVIVALALTILACGGGAAATATTAPTNTPRPTATDEPVEEPTDEPTDEPEEDPTDEPTAEPDEEPTQGIAAGELSISSSNAYVDEYDYVHVVGLLFNDTEEPVSFVELTLELVDSSGETVLTDFDDAPVDEVTFSPFLWTIGPGETSPFDYTVYLDGRDPGDWEYTVTVTDVSDGTTNRGSLEVVNDQITSDEFGTLYLTGELVNLNDEPVLVNAVAAALFDDSDNVLAGDASYNYARYLAPNGDESGNDRTPFSISLDGPVPDASSYIVYWDADLTDELDTTAGLSLQLVNAYADDFDDIHVVAVVSSEAGDLRSIQVVAGLYAEDGTVLDSATLWVPVYLGEGGAVPITFDYFSSVNSNPDELARVSSYSVQFDAYGTYESTFDVVALETANETSETASNGRVDFTGDVVNASGEALSSAIVIMALYDTEDNLVVSNWTSVYPDDETFADGESLPFSLSLYLDSEVDTTGWSFRSFVQGYVE